MSYLIKKILPNQQILIHALSLINATFDEFEAPDYSEEGIQEFKQFIERKKLSKNLADGQLIMWGCFQEGSLIGVIAVRPPNHIALLFVDKNYHRQGIASLLCQTVLKQIIRATKSPDITVNSSPYAEKFYKSFGFTKTDNLQIVNGIQFIPMKKAIS